MVGAELFFRAILASVFLMTAGIDGLEQWCPAEGIIDLTGETPDASEFVNKSGLIFPRNSTWSMDNRTFGCICDFKYCVPYCCPVGFAADMNGCVADRLTPLGYGRLGWKGEDLFLIGNPCGSTWKDFASRTSAGYGESESVLLYMDMMNELYHPGDYCIYRKPNSTMFRALMCDEKPAVSYEMRDIWISVCDSIAIVFMMATFVVYAMLPELRNLQGWIILNCLASYVTSRILLEINTVLFVFWSITITDKLWIATVHGMRDFSDGAYVLWLNVMSFDIWKKFRTIQSSRNIDIKKRQRATLTRYSIYVWITSAIHTAISLFWLWVPYDSYSDSESRLMILYLYGIPSAIIFISNICFYSLAGLKIKQCKRETAHMVGGMNKHHQENQKWFNLNLKLFIMTGWPIIFWAVSNFWTNSILFMVVSVTEALQCIFIFVMFVWKDDVLSSIRGVFSGMQRKLASCLCRNSRPVIANGN